MLARLIMAILEPGAVDEGLISWEVIGIAACFDMTPLHLGELTNLVDHNRLSRRLIPLHLGLQHSGSRALSPSRAATKPGMPQAHS